MTYENFMRIFVDVSNKIIKLGIENGYFDPNKKQELSNKLSNVINRGINELDDSQGLAYFNPNNQTLGFNLNQITTEGDAITLILHEEKHILDYFIDCDNITHVDNSHVGFHYQHSGNGIGQNESITDRFAINMAKLFTNNNIRTRTFDAFYLSFETDMIRYQVEDKLIQLFCTSTGITLDELISMQNDENMDRLDEIISKFNEFADYERYSVAIDGIYELRYGANGKEDAEFSEEDIRKMHEYIQLAQEECEKYITCTSPERLEKINSGFITTDPRYKIDEERKNNLVSIHRGTKQTVISNLSIADMFSRIRIDLAENNIEENDGLTLQQIGQKTARTFSSNPRKAGETFEILETGVKVAKEIEEQTQGEG